MIWSAAKKKIDANATITNTMIVVIVVSRRVGQVTLAVSERTSCKNLNGLKAIAVPRPLTDVLNEKGETGRSRLKQALSAQPSVQEGGAGKRARLFGDFNCRAGYPPLSGPAAGGGYLLPYAPKVKVGTRRNQGLSGG